MDDHVSDEEWRKVEAALSGLITSKTRPDGRNWEDAFANMPVYFERLGLNNDLNNLNVLHVAGTKGKGSTCSFVSSILTACGYQVGLFTSPHLCDVRERVRIDRRMVSRACFSAAFWRCYDRLQAACDDAVGMPAYFRFLTLLAIAIFLERRVDVAVMEVGLGGRLDATNVFARPVATCVTTLDYDHTELLGDTLTLIAREKAGIFRRGVPALTCAQRPEAKASLQAAADEVGAPLTEVATLDRYEASGGAVQLGLDGDFQRVNAALAVAMCREWDERAASGTSPHAAAAAERLRQLRAGRLPESYAAGLASCTFAGRAQRVTVPLASLPGEPGEGDGSLGAQDEREVTLFLDGAHSPESSLACATWFCRASGSGEGATPLERILLFNCGQDRDAEALLGPLAQTFLAGRCSIACALFVPPQSTYASLQPDTAPHGDLAWQHANLRIWTRLYSAHGGRATGTPSASTLPSAAAARPLPTGLMAHLGAGGGPEGLRAAVHPSLQSALQAVKRAAQAMPRARLHVLVTGSLHLVGDTLRLIGRSAD